MMKFGGSNVCQVVLGISCIATLALGVTLACGLFAPATPQPEATLDSLYTAAAETLNAMSTQAAATQPADVHPDSPPCPLPDRHARQPMPPSRLVPPPANRHKMRRGGIRHRCHLPRRLEHRARTDIHQDLAHQERRHLHMDDRLRPRLRER
ncbi:MAG: hypothetical protein MZV64_33015 [Ignavibacteriales bacterium]|nr:hypothetical protein [Ignavibacteriales bacterium]